MNIRFYQPFAFTGFIMFIFFIIDLIKNHHFDINLFVWSIGMIIAIYFWVDEHRKNKYLKNVIEWIE